MAIDPSIATNTVVFGLVGLLGLAVGSFLNVVATRLPATINDTGMMSPEPVQSPRSICPACRTPIQWFDNIPLLSFLLLKGRCRHCGASISIRYPILELAGAAAIIVSFAVLGLGWSAVFATLFLWLLIAITAIDIETQLIPDALSITGLLIGLIYALTHGLEAAAMASTGAILGFVVLWSLAAGYKAFTGRDGMGGGDPKLAAMLGAWLGPLGLWLALSTAFVSGTVIAMLLMVAHRADAKAAIPFGPFLCLGGAIALLVEMRNLPWLDAWMNLVIGG